VKLESFAGAAAAGGIVLNALNGRASIPVAGRLPEELKGKILVDISNPLDFSNGMPPTLTVCNTDSLGEQIQRILPGTKVVKIFNTVTASIQVDPSTLAGGDHNLFICGNDPDAKAKVSELAKSYGWKWIIDLGGIISSRGAEMMLPIWIKLWGVLETPNFNFKIVH
jgi:predicted dinucleotide-binding enzyme